MQYWSDRVLGTMLAGPSGGGVFLPNPGNPPRSYINMKNGTWHHVALAVTADLITLTAYVNGAAVSVSSDGLTTYRLGDLRAGKLPTTIHVGSCAPRCRGLVGCMDDLAVFSRALRAEEVLQIAAAARPRPPSVPAAALHPRMLNLSAAGAAASQSGYYGPNQQNGPRFAMTPNNWVTCESQLMSGLTIVPGAGAPNVQPGGSASPGLATWTLDLGAPTSIAFLVLFGRQPTWGAQSNFLKVYVGNSSSPDGAETADCISDAASGISTAWRMGTRVDCPPGRSVGRYVIVQRSAGVDPSTHGDLRYLSLCEVQVFVPAG